MKEGVVGAVFDYAMGEIADAVLGGLRAAGPERLSVAGRLGLPQVVCPGGAEHIGLILSEPNVVPEAWEGRAHVFHNPIIFAPRLNGEELTRVARSARERLSSANGRTVLMIPLRGVSRYSTPGAPLHDPEADRAFFAELARDLPASIELVELDAGAEDPAFVEEAVRRLIGLIEG